MKAFIVAALFLLTVNAYALPSCKDTWAGKSAQFRFDQPYTEFYSKIHREECEKDWGILVYMAADNDLFPYALMDLYEMEAKFKSGNFAGSTTKTDLLVHVNGPEKNDERRIHIYSGNVKFEKKTTQDFEGKNLSMVHSPVVENILETEDPEQKKLSDFLSWAIKKYPAKHYMVVVWGHGQGWKSFPVTNPITNSNLNNIEIPQFPTTTSDKNFGGIAFQNGSSTALDIPGLKNALQVFPEKTGQIADLYVSDACFMQMLEVSYELSSSARFIVGSTQVQSFLGLPYRRILYELNTGKFNGVKKSLKNGDDAKDEAYLMAKMIPELMKQSLDPEKGSQGQIDKESYQYVTSSAVTSSEMQHSLIPYIQNLGENLKLYVQENPMRSLDLQFIMQKAPAFEGGAQDFGVFLGMLELMLMEEREKEEGTEISENLWESIRRTKNILNETVLSFAYGSAYPQDQALVVGFIPRAVSLWLPVSSEEYLARKNEFQVSQFYRDTKWNQWLDLIF